MGRTSRSLRLSPDGQKQRIEPLQLAANKNGTTFYINGNTWFQPMFGANGVHYQVVQAP